MRLSFKQDYSPLIKLALPLVLTGLAQTSLTFFENIFLAHLSEQSLAAGALVSWLFGTLVVILFGTFSAVNVLIAHKHGAKDNDAIALILRDGFILALLLTIPTFLLIWNASSIFILLGQESDLASLAKLYLHGLAWGILPKFILIILFELLLGLGHSRVIMIITLAAIPFYIFLSYVLIFGKFGLPMLAIAGAGWGLTVGDWIVASLVCIYVLSSKTYRPYIQAMFSSRQPSYLWEIIHVGLPMGLMFCLEVGFFFTAALLMGLIDVQALAANQIAMQYLGPLMSLIFCISQAVTVRMGHLLGAKDPLSAERTNNAGVVLCALFMGLIALCYWTFPTLLISIDFDPSLANNAALFSQAKSFLAIAAIFQIFEAMRVAYFGGLRALKDTRFTLLNSILCFWCIPIPIGCLLAFYFKFGGLGLWCGMVLGAVFGAFFLRWRFNIKIKTAKRSG